MEHTASPLHFATILAADAASTSKPDDDAFTRARREAERIQPGCVEDRTMAAIEAAEPLAYWACHIELSDEHLDAIIKAIATAADADLAEFRKEAQRIIDKINKHNTVQTAIDAFDLGFVGDD